jgi:hypothetical protein
VRAAINRRSKKGDRKKRITIRPLLPQFELKSPQKLI